jgi:hypothetical protein
VTNTTRAGALEPGATEPDEGVLGRGACIIE